MLSLVFHVQGLETPKLGAHMHRVLGPLIINEHNSDARICNNSLYNILSVLWKLEINFYSILNITLNSQVKDLYSKLQEVDIYIATV